MGDLSNQGRETRKQEKEGAITEMIGIMGEREHDIVLPLESASSRYAHSSEGPLPLSENGQREFCSNQRKTWRYTVEHKKMHASSQLMYTSSNQSCVEALSNSNKSQLGYNEGMESYRHKSRKRSGW